MTNAIAIFRVLLAGLLAGVSAFACAQSSANFANPAFAVNAGVGDMDSTNFRARASVGQPFDAATLSSPGFTVATGLFAIPVANSTPTTLPVFNTGVAADRTLLPGGSVDPHYTLIASAEPTLPGPNAIVTSHIADGFWLAQGPDSKWIAPSANQSYPGSTPCNAAGTYTYRTVIDLTGFNPATVVIQGKWAVDNAGTALLLNGVSTGATSGGYGSFATFTLNSGFTAGVNTLDFVTSDGGCPNGFRAELSGAAMTSGATAPVITSGAPANGSVGNAYSHTFTASGVPAAMSWSVTLGTLPDGLSLNAMTGVLSGTPTSAGNFGFIVQAANGVLPDATQTVFLAINSATFSPSASTLTFAVQAVSTTSAAKTLTITNTGGATMTFSAPAITGPFAIGTNNCTSVAPAGTCTILVTFTPVSPGTATGTLTMPTNAPGSPHVIALAGTGAGVMATGPQAYVANNASNNVSVIDTASNTVIAIIPVGVAPYGVAVNPAGTRAYVANTDSDTVSVIDTATFNVVATVTVGDMPYKVAINSTGSRAYVTNYFGGSVSVIDTASNTVESTVAVGSAPVGVALSSNDFFFYVSTGNSVAMYSTPGNVLLTTIPLGTVGPWDVAMHPNGAIFYVPNLFTSNLSVVHTGTNTVFATVPVGATPVDVAVNAAGTRAYVANAGNNTVSVLDTASNAVLASVAVGSQPYGVAVNPAGTYTYTANIAGGDVSVIDNATNSVVATIAVGSWPRAIAIGPAPIAAPSATYLPAGGLNFGSVTVGSTSASQTVTFTNTSSVTFTMNGISFNSGGAGFNVLGSSQCLAQPTLAAGASCTFDVTAAPGATGPQSDTVRVMTTPAHVATPANVALQVTGTAGVPAATYAYISSESSGTVSVINIATNAVVATIPVGNGAFGVAVNPAATRVYVANGGNNTVSVIDTATNTVSATVAVGNIPQGVAVTPAGTRAYVANGSSNTVSVIDTANNTVITTVTGIYLATGVVANPAGGKVYVTGGGSVSAIDTATNTIVATLNTGVAPINGITVNSSGTYLYVAHSGNDEIYVLDAATLAIVENVDLDNGSPTGVALNPSGTRLYVTKYSGNSVTVIDTATLMVLANITVGTQPIGVTVSPDGTRAYVAVNYPGSVAVIDTATNVVIDNVTVGNGATAFGHFIGTPPPAATVPGAPVIGTAAAGDGQATISFTAPASNGGSPITSYVVSCVSPTFTASGASSPITVTGLTNGTGYTCNVKAVNAIGQGAASGNVSVTPSSAPGFSPSTSSFTFASQAVATTSAAQTLTITNAGTAALTIAVPAITGPFAISANTCTTVAPAGTCTISLTFTPLATGAATGTLMLTTNASGSPHAIALTGTGAAVVTSAGYAYITNQNSNNVSVIDLSTDTVVATIPVGSLPYGVAVNPAGMRVYVTNSNSNNVKVIDTASNTVVATISVGTYPNGVAVSPDGTRVYVANSSNSVSVINTATNTVIATVTAGTTPFGVAVNPAGTRVYVTNNNGNNVSVIDTATNTVVTTIPVGFGPHGVAINPAGTRAYVANSSGGVSVINTTTNTVIATVSTGSSPVGIAVSPDGTRVYMADAGGTNGSVKVIDAATNTLITSITVGRLPIGIALNATGTRAYVANRNDNNVGVIDTSTNTVLHTIPVGNQPNAFGLFIALPAPAPVITFTPPALTYPPQLINTSLEVPLVIQNTGDDDLILTQPATITGPFSLPFSNQCGNNTTVLPGFNVFCNVTFHPTAVGPAIGTLTIYSNAPGSPHLIPLSGSGITTAPVINFTPTSLNYPPQLINTSLEVPLAIQNTGDGNLILTQAPTITGPFSLPLSNQCGNNTTVVPGFFTFCNVTFRPTAVGPVTGTLTIYSNAPGSPHVIPLSGSGTTTAPVINFHPASLDYPPQRINTSLEVPLAIQNTGDGNLIFTQAPAITGPFSLPLSNHCGNNTTVVPGFVTFCNVTFRPTAVGPVTGTLTIYSNAPGSPHVIPLSGSGFTTVPVINFYPESLAYPPQLINTSLEVPFAVQNTGDGDLILTQAATITGPFSLQFFNHCGNNTIVPPGFVTFCGVTFRPTAVGPVTGTLTIYSNAPGSPHVIALSGSGVAVGATSLTGVTSRKAHGLHGNFELPLDQKQPVGGNVTVEPRIIGAGHQIVFKFDAPITNAGSLVVTDSTGASITGATAVASGNEVIVTLSGNLNERRVAIALTGINGSVNASVALGFLVADVNNSQRVNAVDTSRIKARAGQPTNASNFLYDINTSGRITAVDVVVSKVLSGTALP